MARICRCQTQNEFVSTYSIVGPWGALCIIHQPTSAREIDFGRLRRTVATNVASKLCHHSRSCAVSRQYVSTAIESVLVLPTAFSQTLAPPVEASAFGLRVSLQQPFQGPAPPCSSSFSNCHADASLGLGSRRARCPARRRHKLTSASSQGEILVSFQTDSAQRAVPRA